MKRFFDKLLGNNVDESKSEIASVIFFICIIIPVVPMMFFSESEWVTYSFIPIAIWFASVVVLLILAGISDSINYYHKLRMRGDSLSVALRRMSFIFSAILICLVTVFVIVGKR